jgi:peptidoglycan hydrolase-like protein with peptidoglycan-binding domain
MRRLLLVAGVGAFGIATVVAVTPRAGVSAQEALPSASTPTRTTSQVERRTLRLQDDLDGTLGYEGSLAIAAGQGGTVTRLPAAGTTVTRGQNLYELDGRRRGIVLYGARPMWRTLSEATTRGSDVRQLERNLSALHLLARKEVDGVWDDDTTTAVKRFEKRQHLSIDGVLTPGDIVFLPSAIRVDESVANVGSAVGPGSPLLKATTTRRTVTIDLAVKDLTKVAAGDAVTIELPDGSTAEGTVREIGRTVTSDSSDQGFPTGDSGDPTVKVTVDLVSADAAKQYDAAPVTVRVTRETRENVLAVPVNALVALLEGGYAVEVVADDGSTHLVGVETGLFDGGWVEVRGSGIADGQKVVVPS